MWLFSNTVVPFHSQVEPPLCESWEPEAFDECPYWPQSKETMTDLRDA